MKIRLLTELMHWSVGATGTISIFEMALGRAQMHHEAETVMLK